MLTVYGEPLVEVLAFWKDDSHAEVAAAERGLGISLELILLGPLGDVALWLECARFG